jgi:hypothetical protein
VRSEVLTQGKAVDVCLLGCDAIWLVERGKYRLHFQGIQTWVRTNKLTKHYNPKHQRRHPILTPFSRHILEPNRQTDCIFLQFPRLESNLYKIAPEPRHQLKSFRYKQLLFPLHQKANIVIKYPRYIDWEQEHTHCAAICMSASLFISRSSVPPHKPRDVGLSCSPL